MTSATTSTSTTEQTPLLPTTTTIVTTTNASQQKDYRDNDNYNYDGENTSQSDEESLHSHHDQNDHDDNVMMRTTTMEVLNHSRILLYISHFCAQFSETAWQFALLLFLGAFVQYQSLLLVSTYGLLSNGAICLFSTYVGYRFIDRSANRWRSVRILIMAQNLCVIVASMQCYLLLRQSNHIHVVTNGNHNDTTTTANDPVDNPGSSSPHDHSHVVHSIIPTDLHSILLLIGIHLFGPIANILDRGITVTMERDWVVVMGQVAISFSQAQQPPEQTQGDDTKNATTATITNVAAAATTTTTSSSSWLVETNVTMKQIDLCCKILSPAIAGLLIDLFDRGNQNNHHLPTAALIVSIINIISLLGEYICCQRIYTMIPELHHKQITEQSNNHSNDTTISMEMTDQEIKQRSSILVRCLPSSLLLYLQQPVSYAGIGLSLLYLNTLTFGGVMMSYLLYRGMKISTVGTWRGISSLIGLLGTIVYQKSIQRGMNIITTGMYSVLYQLLCISFSMISMFVSNFHLSMAFMIIGVCTSRIGLYVFEISVTQLMQMNIPEGIRGTIGGIQESCNAFFQLSSFALCLVFSNPHDFIIPVAAGYIAVASAALLYSIGIYRQSHHFITKPHTK